MRRVWRLAVALWLAAALPLAAQEPNNDSPPVTLVADVLEVAGETRIVAEGDVRIYAAGRSLSASRIVYDRAADRVTIEGPIVLREGPDLVVFADIAELSPDLQAGVLGGARLVLRRQLQIAGSELRRSEGRFNELQSVVATSCTICAEGETPLWEIRAERVIHDQEAARVYFYNARFRVAGIPIFYLPALRLPDGTVDRLTGVLTPSFRSTTQLGPGVKVPYFITLGRSADLTLTPYVATDYTRTLEARYRQAFRNGDLIAEGAVSRDSILPGETRGYLFAEGNFDIPRGFDLRFNIETTTDDPYLQDYDFSSKDRLDSAIGVIRTRDRERIEAETVYYQSLRPNEDNDFVTTFLGDARWNRRLALAGPGGWLDADLIAHFHQRPSNLNVLGRDVAQMRGRLGWSRAVTGPAGLRLSTDVQLNGDLKYILQDDRFDETQIALTPVAALRLGWPLAADGTGGDRARYLLEPVAQVVWAAPDRLDSPNDDSTLISFDTGNLLALNRFPGLDRYEEGLRADVALRWSRLDPDGWSLGTTIGRTYRRKDRGQFPASTGLSGDTSDWLAQVDLDLGQRLSLRNLLLLDDRFDTTLNETRLSWRGDGLELASSYVWQRSDRALELDRDLSELAVDATYDINPAWAARLDLRRDLTDDRTNRAGVGVTWQNECVRVDLSALRRFRATEDIEPTTSYGLSVTLAGFGADGAGPARRCNG